MPEHNRFLRGMVSWLGFRQVPLEFVREERFAGTTKYPLKKMLKLASDGIVSFSGKPFGIMRVLGGLLLAAGLVDLLALLIAHAVTGASGGWPYVIAAVLAVGGANLLALGICGVYFERMYDELKGRPLYIVRQVLRSEGPGGQTRA